MKLLFPVILIAIPAQAQTEKTIGIRHCAAMFFLGLLLFFRRTANS